MSYYDQTYSPPIYMGGRVVGQSGLKYLVIIVHRIVGCGDDASRVVNIIILE